MVLHTPGGGRDCVADIITVAVWDLNVADHSQVGTLEGKKVVLTPTVCPSLRTCQVAWDVVGCRVVHVFVSTYACRGRTVG